MNNSRWSHSWQRHVTEMARVQRQQSEDDRLRLLGRVPSDRPQPVVNTREGQFLVIDYGGANAEMAPIGEVRLMYDVSGYFSYIPSQSCKKSAKDFFYEFLTEDERIQWEERGFIEVTSQRGLRYILTDNKSFNVCRGDTDYCLTCGDGLPLYDDYALQKFLLEHDESLFMEKSNKRLTPRRYTW